MGREDGKTGDRERVESRKKSEKGSWDREDGDGKRRVTTKIF
jgi:hypothetical protein